MTHPSGETVAFADETAVSELYLCARAKAELGGTPITEAGDAIFGYSVPSGIPIREHQSHLSVNLSLHQLMSLADTRQAVADLEVGEAVDLVFEPAYYSISCGWDRLPDIEGGESPVLIPDKSDLIELAGSRVCFYIVKGEGIYRAGTTVGLTVDGPDCRQPWATDRITPEPPLRQNDPERGPADEATVQAREYAGLLDDVAATRVERITGVHHMTAQECTALRAIVDNLGKLGIRRA